MNYKLKKNLSFYQRGQTKRSAGILVHVIKTGLVYHVHCIKTYFYCIIFNLGLKLPLGTILFPHSFFCWCFIFYDKRLANYYYQNYILIIVGLDIDAIENALYSKNVK